MKNSVTKVVLAALAIGFTGATAAQAQVSCGAVITEKVVMTTDLLCFFNSPAFTIDGGDVDMNGHGVGCMPGSDGIAFINSGGKLRNGHVQNCDDGVILAGSGKHAVTNVLVRGGNRGFVLLSPKNKLVRNTVIGAAVDGFKIASVIQPMAHILVGNVASNNGESGFDLTGDGSKLSQNLASGNGLEGFKIEGDGNKLSRNTSYDNGGIGVSVNGAENSFSLNSSIGNASWGFAPYGEAAKVKGNLALDNNGVGFGSTAAGNTYSGNMSAFNAQSGYVVFGAGVVLSRNAAIGNGEHGLLTGLASPDVAVKGNRMIDNGGIGINMQAIDSTISGNFAVSNGTSDADDNQVDCNSNTWKKNIIYDAADACIE